MLALSTTASVRSALRVGVKAGPSLVGGPLRRARVKRGNSLVLGYGGRELDLTVLDLESGASLFKAKNVSATRRRVVFDLVAVVAIVCLLAISCPTRRASCDRRFGSPILHFSTATT